MHPSKRAHAAHPSLLVFGLFLAVSLFLWFLPASAGAYAAFDFGVHEPRAFHGPSEGLYLDRTKRAGASISRATVNWSQIAPDSADRPAGFNAPNPADPQYRWETLDAFVRNAAARGLQPLITSLRAPLWAEGAGRSGAAGAFKPNPADYGDFASALAARYSGRFPDPLHAGRALPRVRYFQAWNEPNLGIYLAPILRRSGDSTVDVRPAHYARMLNAFYAGIKRVDASNRVITAGLAPGNGNTGNMLSQRFMRSVLCLTKVSGELRRISGCSDARLPHFDAWAHHPYTFTGTPTSKSGSSDGGLLGNVPSMVTTLKTAVRFGHVRPVSPKGFWVTEFNWLTNPPGFIRGGQQVGKSPATQARYLSETAYRLWRAGVTKFVWYLVIDYRAWPGGFYFEGTSPTSDSPKPALQAARFPFYAERVGTQKLRLWALAHGGGSTTVSVERLTSSGWKATARLASDSRGMVWKDVSTSPRGTFRAKVLSGPKRGLISYPHPAG